MKTAKALWLTVPLPLLAIADEAIEKRREQGGKFHLREAVATQFPSSQSLELENAGGVFHG